MSILSTHNNLFPFVSFPTSLRDYGFSLNRISSCAKISPHFDSSTYLSFNNCFNLQNIIFIFICNMTLHHQQCLLLLLFETTLSTFLGTFWPRLSCTFLGNGSFSISVSWTFWATVSIAFSSFFQQKIPRHNVFPHFLH